MNATMLAKRFRAVRMRTVELCTPLGVEDQLVQPMADASPTKWHLAHTTWFFETIVLRAPDPEFNFLFNSYYETLGPRVERARRGMLSRPTLERVHAYRDDVDARMAVAIAEGRADADLVELGLHHEQQHQELILTDLKYTLGTQPLRPAYREDLPGASATTKQDWRVFDHTALPFGSAASPGQARLFDHTALPFGSAASAGQAQLFDHTALPFGSAASPGQARLFDHTALPFGSAASPGQARLFDHTALPFGSAASPGQARLFDHTALPFGSAASPGQARLFDHTALPFGSAASPGQARLFDHTALPFGSAASPGQARLFDGGVIEIGASATGFAFDNERPRHRVFVEPFRIATRALTNRDVQAFIAAGGYRDAKYWLSDGWSFITAERITAPLYWDGDQTYTLAGMRAIDPDATACHLSYYEADALARWRGARLPTEAEWELAAIGADPQLGNFADDNVLQPHEGGMFGDVWEWTQSSYLPYPGFRELAGAVGEYNGKFMSGQQVLRGGSCFTPRDHIRASYRNFFPPSARWQMSGVRLAQDGGRR